MFCIWDKFSLVFGYDRAGQPLNFYPGFTDAYVYGLYGLHRLINDATRIPHIRHWVKNCIL